MKGFQKLALVTAIAAAPFAAQAELTAMDDALLSEMTGQSGITIDADVQMSIENIVYVDGDGGANGKGAITLSNILVGEITAGSLSGAASIKGITIDVDSNDGLVIGIGQIGDATGNGIDISVESITIGDGGGQLAVLEAKTAEFGNQVVAIMGSKTLSQADAITFLSTPANAGDADYDASILSITNVTTAAALAAQSGNVGGVVIENFKNYVEDDSVGKYNALFGMAITDSEGSINTNSNDLDNNGRYIQAEIKIAGTGNAALGTSGLQIDALIGGGMDKMAWVTGQDTDADTVADAFHEVGVRDFAFFGSSDADGDGITDTLEAMEISVTIDVVDHESWNNATPGTVDVAALHISNMVVKGSIQMGDIYMSSTTASVSEQSLGGVLIKNIDMTGTDVYIYGH